MLKDEELNNNTKRYLINDFDQVLSLDLLTGEEDLSPEFIEEIEALISERNEAKKKIKIMKKQIKFVMNF